MKKTLAYLLGLLAYGSLFAQTVDTLLWQQIPRTYQLHLPSGYDPAQQYPLVVACHPGLSNAAQHAGVARWQLLGDTAGFITVYPNGMPTAPNANTRLWNAYNQPSAVSDYDDVGFLNALLDRLIEEYAVDTCRIFMSGFSNGAMMTYRMACDFTHRFAAMAPLSGGWGYGADGFCGDGNCNGDVAPGCTWKMAYLNCQPSAPIPMIFMKGSLEGDNLPTCRGTIDSLNRLFWSDFLACNGSWTDTLQAAGEIVLREHFTGCDADFEFCTVPGNGHQWHAPATPMFWSFFRKHSKCAAVSTTPDPFPADTLTIYPNPASGGALFIGFTDVVDYTVTLWDTLGRSVYQEKNAVRIPVSGFAPGLYTLVLENKRQRVSRRVVLW